MFNFKFSLLAVIFLISLQGCVPLEPATVGQAGQSRYVPKADSAKSKSAVTKTPASKTDPIVLNYRNESSGIEINLDPNKDQFFLDLKGMKPAQKDTVVIADSTLINERTNDIQQVLAKFRQAQDLFYLEEYTKALRLLNETLEIAETADAYALKGTIHFMLGNKSATRENWNNAVQINPDLPIPSIPELEDIVEDIINDEERAESPDQ